MTRAETVPKPGIGRSSTVTTGVSPAQRIGSTMGSRKILPAVLNAGRNLPHVAADFFHLAERVFVAREFCRIAAGAGVRETAFERGAAEHL